MRQNLVYSFIAFLLLFIYLYAGFLTQTVMDAEKLESAPSIFAMVFAFSAIASLLFFFILSAVQKRFATHSLDQNYRPSRRLVVIASVLMVISLSFGVFQSYSGVMEKRQVAEAEKLRFAAMTPEQRAAEAKRKDEQIKAAAQTAAALAQYEAKKKAQASEPEKKVNPADLVKIVSYQARKGGFDLVMIGTFKIKNENAFAIKDMLIVCAHFAPSGTELPATFGTLYERLAQGQTKVFKDVNLGIIHPQGATFRCSIADVAIG